VLEGIGAAAAAGFEVVKLNCVLLRGINDDQIIPLAEFGEKLGMPVRFIELMPLAPGGPIDDRHFFSVTEAMERLSPSAHSKPPPTNPPATARPVTTATAPATSASSARSPVPTSAPPATNSASPPTANSAPASAATAKSILCPHCEATMVASPTPSIDAIANKPENHTFAEDFEVQRPMTAIGG
jgi:GTP 3',8-cyclase